MDILAIIMPIRRTSKDRVSFLSSQMPLLLCFSDAGGGPPFGYRSVESGQALSDRFE